MLDGFWENVSRYPRYFIAIILGVFFNAFASLAPLLKRPSTAIAVVSGLTGLVLFIYFTLRAMLGLSPV